MMNCEQIATLLKSWEQNGTLSHRELEDAAAHVAVCSQCAQQYAHQYAALLPLLRRDAGDIPNLTLPGWSKSAPDSDRIMAGLEERIQATRNKTYSDPHFGLPGRLVPLVAAAALILLLPLGYLLYANRNSDTVTVRFVLEAPGATTVTVSGNFNQWSSQDIPLKPDKDGKTWSATVKLKRSFEYRYNFVIDNQIWIADPNAAVSIDDDFGGKVSLLDL